MAGYCPQRGDCMLPAIDCAQRAPGRRAWTEIVALRILWVVPEPRPTNIALRVFPYRSALAI